MVLTAGYCDLAVKKACVAVYDTLLAHAGRRPAEYAKYLMLGGRMLKEIIAQKYLTERRSKKRRARKYKRLSQKSIVLAGFVAIIAFVNGEPSNQSNGLGSLACCGLYLMCPSRDKMRIVTVT